MNTCDAPFPYPGGKSTVADVVWSSLGDVNNYVEPFCGTAAVLLLRPTPPRIETINDADAYIANLWRAVKAEPDAVAELMNWPVNETDLEARHKWLVTAARKREHHERMRDEPDYYDVKIAAWWCWGLCAWIGNHWCAGEWNGRGGDNRGGGVNIKDEVHGGTRPHLGGANGVHQKLPHTGDAGQGECERRRAALREWMNALADRLRNVRVCCGDWLRVCGSTATTTHNGLTAVFLDPPYSDKAGRNKNLYRVDCVEVAHRVRAWCLERGDDPLMRIALCGYEGEGHDELERAGWSVFAWKAQGGMANTRRSSVENTNDNCRRERIWFSPRCRRDPGLFV